MLIRHRFQELSKSSVIWEVQSESQTKNDTDWQLKPKHGARDKLYVIQMGWNKILTLTESRYFSGVHLESGVLH